ncbi:MAG TPA: 4Fe-4S dicluster domain-containing protein [Candidatus Binatia bacterium]
MNWDEDQRAGEYPNAYFFYLPRLCNHCTRPSCVEACPHGAMYKRPESASTLTLLRSRRGSLEEGTGSGLRLRSPPLLPLPATGEG